MSSLRCASAFLVLIAGLYTAGCDEGGGTCVPMDGTTCESGTAYWVDSCGQRGAVVQTCACGCHANGEDCQPDCPCVPACGGKECGDDGCQGSCGACTAPEACDALGQCGCAPACGGKECGDDGCGGSCGACTAPEACDALGQCGCAAACTGLECGNDPVCGTSCGACQAPETCQPDGTCACAPDCTGRVCGTDGCGGSCGACDPGAGEVCVEATGQCEQCTPECTGKECGLDSLCGASCGTCGASETCDAAGQCQCAPACAGKACGDDGCGGTCGSCGATEYCDGTSHCVAVPAGSCFDGQAVRAIRAPQAASLVINEFMANPEAVVDAAGEWLEVYTSADFDLNGLELGESPPAVDATVTGGACLPVAADSYFVLAASRDPVANGGLPRVDALLGMSLSNTGAQGIFVGHAGQVQDAITYSSTGVGASTALDPSKRNPADNDAAGNWCPGAASYGAGDLGTPGAANPSCGLVTPGMCLEGGAERPKVAPVVGDLVIDEVMANPATAADADGEWFELYVGRDVDLNGLQLGRAANGAELTLPEGECRRVTAGSHLLFARETDPLVNGGLPAVDVRLTFGLNNTNGDLFVGLVSGDVLDAIGWATALSGVASSLDPALRNPTDNDLDGSWCPAVDDYGTGVPPDKGTPAAANPVCQ